MSESSISASLRRVLGRQPASDPDDRRWVPGDRVEKIIPPALASDRRDAESDDVWGFRDSGFVINDRGHVEMIGDRYPLSGEDLSDFIPWAKEVMGIDFDPTAAISSSYPTRIPEPCTNETFVKELETFLDADQISDEQEVRLRHGHGHTLKEMYAIKHGDVARVPDLVVYPESDDEVTLLVQAAGDHDVVLIPYGGGTSVTEALLCPENETRTIASVDMSRLNRILWIDPANRMALIQAGAVGRDITDQLAEYGFTMGHEPDSVEFSTLGGWVATNASGMKKNKYGNIEDIVLDVSVVTAEGALTRSSIAPRESVGMDARQWIFGSEGNLGIVTSAVVKLFPLPAVQEFGSILFPTFEDGVAFMYELTQAGDPPASVRLVDNLQFQFSMALKPASKGARKLKSMVEKQFVTKVKGYDPDRMTACTLVFEGSEDEVESQQARVKKIAADHGGMLAGGSNGERGYALTFSIAYIRDFIMTHWVMGESFETSVPWSQVLDLVENVKRRVVDEHAERGLPANPFISARVTQIYDTGVCVYFYLGLGSKGLDDPVGEFAAVERACREEILASGGSLSHHHGVGKLRKHFLPEIMSPTAIEWNKKAKDAVDPGNVFGAGNMLETSSDH